MKFPASSARGKSRNKPSKNGSRFSFYWFFLIFWLTVVATVLLSWSMIVS